MVLNLAGHDADRQQASGANHQVEGKLQRGSVRREVPPGSFSRAKSSGIWPWGFFSDGSWTAAGEKEGCFGHGTCTEGPRRVWYDLGIPSYSEVLCPLDFAVDLTVDPDCGLAVTDGG